MTATDYETTCAPTASGDGNCKKVGRPVGSDLYYLSHLIFERAELLVLTTGNRARDDQEIKAIRVLNPK